MTDASARWFLRCYGTAVYVFLYTPIAMLIVLSFNDSNSITLPWGGFTLRWYRALAENQSLFVSLKNSLTLGLITAVLSTVIGALAACAFRSRFRGQIAAMRMLLLPFVIPGLTIGVALLRKEGMDIRYGMPKERAIAWFASYVVSKDTKVQPACYAFLDWVIDEKFATSMAKDFGYRMTTTAHMKNLTPAEIKEMQLDDIGGLVSKLFIQELPENLNDWVQAWSEFKSA